MNDAGELIEAVHDTKVAMAASYDPGAPHVYWVAPWQYSLLLDEHGTADAIDEAMTNLMWHPSKVNVFGP